MNVRFLSVKLKSTFDALLTKEPNALYWIEDVQSLYKGDTLFGTGALASEKAAGLLSPEDYAALKSLIEAGVGVGNLAPIDGTISIFDTANNGKAIGVNIAPIAGNQLIAVDGGLFVPTVVVPEYSIEKQATAEEGFAASYKLKKTVDGVETYMGDVINLPKDMVLKSAALETVTNDGVPYAEAKVGDPYIKMEFNDVNTSALYIPVKGLVDTYTAGSGIEIVNNVVSVKLADITHGLVAVDGALSLTLATRNSDGAMSKEDKKALDAIPYAYVARKYEITDAPTGTLVNYRDDEIRIMCPADATYTKQSVGIGGDANTYYVTLKTYAPGNDAVGYREHLGNQSDVEILTDIKIDQYGRRYQSTWLGVAKFDETTGVWTYYGDRSSIDEMIGWSYRIDWYNNDEVKIYTDSIRINLSNEDCHNSAASASVHAVTTELKTVKESVTRMEELYTWSEM